MGEWVWSIPSLRSEMGRSTIKSVPSAVPAGPPQFAVALDCSDRAKAPARRQSPSSFSRWLTCPLRAERCSREYGLRTMSGSLKLNPPKVVRRSHRCPIKFFGSAVPAAPQGFREEPLRTYFASPTLTSPQSESLR
jgi:hypothetical protein